MKVSTIVHDKKRIDPTDEERSWIVNLLNDENLAQAAQFSERLITIYPRSFILFYSLGMSCTLLGEHEKALKYLKHAVTLNPKVADVWRYLGDCCMKLELLDDAKNAYIEALNINPDYSEARRGLAQSMIDPRHFLQSVEKVKSAVEESPDNPHLQLVLGQCYLEQEKYIYAIKHLEKAAEMRPEDPIILTALGTSYAHFHKPKDTLSWFNKAAELEQPRAELLIQKANATKDDGDFDQSIRLAKEAIALNPDGAMAKNELANIYAILGEKENAISLSQEVLSKYPENINAIINLSSYIKVAKGAPEIKLMQKLYNREPETYFEEKQKMNIGFALGKIYGDTNQYAKSIEVLKYANAKRRQIIEFNFQDEIEYFDLMKHVFDPITPDDVASPAKDDRQMIFILGMPRSGTTLTEQIIASHSKVYGAGELNFMNAEIGEMMYMFGLQPDILMKKVAFEHICPKYLNHIESLGMSERIITDKLPHNFLNLGFILCSFPEAKIIHLNRDPAAVCLSCFQKYFPARGMGFTFDLRDLGRYYAMYLDMMDYWRAKFPGRILDLDYKALTEDQEKQSRMLLEHCGLPWQDQCLEFYRTKRGVLTTSQTQVREQMYQGSSDAWKKYRKYIPDLLEELDKAGIKYG